MKTCFTCKQEKEFRQYYKQAKGTLMSSCMECMRESARARYYKVVRPKINKGLRNYNKDGMRG